MTSVLQRAGLCDRLLQFLVQLKQLAARTQHRGLPVDVHTIAQCRCFRCGPVLRAAREQRHRYTEDQRLVIRAFEAPHASGERDDPAGSGCSPAAVRHRASAPPS